MLGLGAGAWGVRAAPRRQARATPNGCIASAYGRAPEALKRSLPTGEHVEIETDREIEARDKESIVALGAVNWRSPARTSVQFEARPGEGIGRRAAQLVEERGYEIRHLSISPVTLEDVFLQALEGKS